MNYVYIRKKYTTCRYHILIYFQWYNKNVSIVYVKIQIEIVFQALHCWIYSRQIKIYLLSFLSTGEAQVNEILTPWVEWQICAT